MVGKITGTISFVEWNPLFEVEKPFELFVSLPPEVPDQRTTNISFKDVPVQIADVRGEEDKLSLDENGFVYRKHATKVTDFNDPLAIEQVYLPETVELLKREVEGADRVFVFNWKVSYPGNNVSLLKF